jgi:glycopeptide antibiotics resistance protein
MPTENMPSLEAGQVDKVYQLIAYTFLSSSWFLYFIVFRNEQKTRKLAIVIAALILFGIIIEVLQANLTDYRTFDWWDVVSNTIGICLAFILFRTNKNKLRKLKLQLNV